MVRMTVIIETDGGESRLTLNLRSFTLDREPVDVTKARDACRQFAPGDVVTLTAVGRMVPDRPVKPW